MRRRCEHTVRAKGLRRETQGGADRSARRGEASGASARLRRGRSAEHGLARRRDAPNTQRDTAIVPGCAFASGTRATQARFRAAPALRSPWRHRPGPGAPWGIDLASIWFVLPSFRLFWLHLASSGLSLLHLMSFWLDLACFGLAWISWACVLVCSGLFLRVPTCSDLLWLALTRSGLMAA